jgi:hypothetical protein
VTPEPIDERTLALFGAIVHWYARYECLMQRIMAKLIGADYSAVILLTKALTFSEKREALLRLLRHRDVPLDQIDAVRGYLKLPSRVRPLCEDIEHSEWMKGAGGAGIQPDWLLNAASTIRPVRKDTDATAPDFFDDDDERTEYVPVEIAETVKRLDENFARFSDYAREIGLIEG